MNNVQQTYRIKHKQSLLHQSYALLSMRQIIKQPMNLIDKEEVFFLLMKLVLAKQPKVRHISCFLLRLVLNKHVQLKHYGIFDSRVIKTIVHISQMNTRRLNLQDLAESVNLSSSRLMYLFKRDTTMSMGDFQAWCKLLWAFKFIMHGRSFVDAAQAAGFVDQAHFSKLCKKKLAMTPSALLSMKVKVPIKKN